MATNTGIEVTALRPAASAGDFYVRPEAYDPSVANGLARLSGTMNKKQKVEDKLTAENLHISDSLNNAKDIHDFSAYAHESAGVVAHLKELRGRSYANRWRTDTENAYKEFAANSDEGGGDYHDFMASRKAELAEAFNGDRFMISGAMGVMAEADQNMRAVHRQFLDQRMRTNTKTELDSQVDVYMDSFKKGNLRIQDVASQIDDAVQTAHNTGGITNTKGNESVFLATVQKYKTTGDPNYLLLAGKLKFARGKQGSVNTKSEAILSEAFEYVEYESEKEQNSLDKAQAKALAQAKVDSQKVVNDKWLKDRDYNPSKEEIQALLDSGHTIMQINSQRNAWATSANTTRTEEHTIAAANVIDKINSNIFNPNGVPVTSDSIQEMLGSKQIHPNDLATINQALKTAQAVTPLLNRPAINTFRKDMVDKLEKSFMGVQSAPNSAAVASLKDSFDRAFIEQLENHYSQSQETPNENELRSYALMARTEATEERSVEQEELKVVSQQASKVKTISDASEETMDSVFESDATVEGLQALLKTRLGRQLAFDLAQDPFILVPFTIPGFEDQFQQVPDREVMIPVHEVLERTLKGSKKAGAGNGGFYLYNQLMKQQGQ